MIGQILAGHYQILQALGKGGFGQTYLAKDLLLPDKQHCVVKQFKPPEDIPPEAFDQARRSFAQEAIILNDLGREHPRIPRLLAYFEHNGQFFLVQEYIAGHNLEQEIKVGEPLAETEVIELLDEILGILEFVHQRNIIHRDIKPSNIMRQAEDGKLFLIDFGTVKQKIPTQMVTVAGAVKSQFAFNSPGYTPPEQLQLRPQLASDIYALGIMAIFALTGIEPRQLTPDKSTGEIKWRDYAARSLTDRISVNPKLADLIARMIRQDYRDRFARATEAKAALQAIAVPPTNILPGSNSQLSLAKKLLAVTALLLTLGGGYYWLQKPKTPLLLTYENTEYGIELDYPDNWVLEKVEDPFGTIARFYPSKGDPNILVTLEAIEVDTNTSLDEYNNLAINQIIKYLPAAKIIDSRPIELNNQPAHRIVYTGKNKHNNITNKYLQVWFKESDQAFTMTYVAPEDKYDDFVETVEQIIILSLIAGEVIN